MIYKENHYVPRWYQERFLPLAGERKFCYLDLMPEQFRDPNGIIRSFPRFTPLVCWAAERYEIRADRNLAVTSASAMSFRSR
jgi:hypothetical protein